ncbi:MAG: tRNA lysidine(34) synthetase TilS [Ignavibacteriae bacterium HGW-Ignavibacteriae-2]|jgi:tRNA(Ile)-lysidine synthase|nr:MAG: tRNA lysidine(34) synthetase TilS [Ignavibacteriae bacterium HGW-Ignavibacteriae-2]
MQRLEKKVIDFIFQKKLILKNDKILLALSGGADSVFAFHFFLRNQKKLGIEFGAFHLNHMLRGNEADSDERFCKDLCEQNNIPFFCDRIDIKNLAKKSAKSFEEYAREIRYKLLEKISSESGYNKSVTAHIMDDNTETVMMNLFKGCGISAIGGIPSKRNNIVRPFLCLTKQEILNFLAKNGIVFRVDSSNINLKFERNFVRQELLPKIKEFINPSVNEAIFRTSGNVIEFYSLFIELIEQNYKKYINKSENTFEINLGLFTEQNNFIIGEVIKYLSTNGLSIEFNTKVLTLLTKLSKNIPGKSINLQDGWIALKERESIYLFKEKSENFEEIRVQIGKSVTFSNRTFESFILEDVNIKISNDKYFELISADNLDDIFILRKWKFGDKFIPLGMRGEKLISDFLTDIKIPSSKKSEVLVLLNRNKIVWVVGLRIHDHYKITKSTKRICKICLK